MPTFNEPIHAAEFLLSEANGDRSRENATVLSGQNLRAAAVVGRITASGFVRELQPAGADGSQNAAGIMYAAVNAAGANARGVIVARDAEVNAALIQWPTGITAPQRTAAIAQLAALGIIVR